jgi:hypothetical protein
MLTLILTVLAVENLAEIFVTKIDLQKCIDWLLLPSWPNLANFCNEMRSGFWDAFPLLNKLAGCKFCEMFWLTGLFLLLPMPLLVTTWLAIHRLAQFLSEFLERYLNRAPLSVFIQKPSDIAPNNPVSPETASGS